MVLYVGNIPYDTAERDLHRRFEAYGSVESVLVMHDKVSANGLGFAFVEMSDAGQAREAVAALDRTRFNGRVIMVCETPDRVERRANPACR